MPTEPRRLRGLKATAAALAAAAAITAMLPGVAAGECGCAANGITPQYGVNYGMYLDTGQTWHFIEGDPLVIGVGSKGAMAVWVCQPNGLTRQYYSEDSWGTNVWLDGASSGGHYRSNYYSGGTLFTEVSHTKNGDWEIVTELGLGSEADLRQVVTYTSGDYYFKRHWELTNTSGSTQSDVRFIHGGDLYFGGDDSARSWWNPTQNMIYVNNNNFTNSGVMGFYGAPATPADHYFGGNYYTGYQQAATTGRLDDSANSNYVDAGYQLEWNHATLANGDTWVIEAYEVWTDPTPVQVLPPADQLTVADAIVAIEFTLHNLDASSRTFDLSVESDLGWTTVLTGGSSVTLAGLEQSAVPVDVTVPAGAASGTSSSITLTAEDSGGGGEGSASTSVEVFEPDYAIDPSSLDFGSVAVGSSSTEDIVITNSGADVTFGTVGNPNGLAAPFTLVYDGCSGQVLSSGESCTLRVSYAPSAVGSADDNFNVPVVEPVVVSHVISVTGNAPGEPEIMIEGNGTEIVDGDTTPSLLDHTDFGRIENTGQRLRTYTIWNTGTDTLAVNSVGIAGGNPSDFSVFSMPATTVLPGGATSVSFLFDPTGLGLRTTTFYIRNDDPDESDYSFAVQGTSYADLSVSSRTPAPNDIGVAAGDNVVVQFNQTIDGATVDESTFVVRGSLSGDVLGGHYGGGTNTITFNPLLGFRAGETVTVTLTTGIEGDLGGGTLPEPVSHQFTVAPTAGHAYFVDSGQSLPGAVTWGVDLADLDGDWDLDVFASEQTGGCRVYLNDGSGTFTDSGQSLGSGTPVYSALGDVDGDGDVDAFTARYGNEPNEVWFNNGSGVFTNSGQSLGSSTTISVELGDLDGDGDLDAYVANYWNQSDRVWFNNGSGVFTDSGQALGSAQGYQMALVDVDGDDDLDAVVADSDGGALVWLNDGSGVFTNSGQVLGTGWGIGIGAGDLDTDGDVDVFVGNYYDQPNRVWLNDGSGTFTDSGQALGSSSTQYVALGDLDNDGDLDAYVGNDGPADRVWLNDGSGTFTDSGQVFGSSYSHEVALGDVDDDGDLDAFISDTSSGDRVWLNVEPISDIAVEGDSIGIADGDTTPGTSDLTDFGGADVDGGWVTNSFTIRNTGYGTLEFTDGYPHVEITGAHAADFTVSLPPSNFVDYGDSTHFDVTFDPSDVGLREATISIANNDPDENPYDFAICGTGLLPLTVDSRTPAPNDPDAPSDADIIVECNQNIDEMSVSAGTFVVRGSLSGEIAGTWSGGGTTAVTFDPDDDFLVGETVTVTLTTGFLGELPGGVLSEPVTWQFTVEAPSGHGTLTESGQLLEDTESRGVALGDLDGDGDLDAFVATYWDGNRVYMNDAGVFTDSGQTCGTNPFWHAALGDLDGDGDLDAFLTNYFTYSNKVWLNNGSGVFSDSGQNLGGGHSVMTALGDLDGDGDLDAFTTNYNGEQDYVWMNDGSGSFTASQLLGTNYSYGVALGDVDDDGDLDAFVADSQGANQLWLNTGNGWFGSSHQTLGSSSSCGVAMGDLDGDGDIDAFVGNSSLDANRVWLNGRGTFTDSGQSLGTSNTRAVALGDMDGDGDLDVYAVNSGGPDAVWLNDGNGVFTCNGQTLDGSQGYGAALGDVDGDGDVDAFVVNNDGRDRVWLNAEPREIDVLGNGLSIADGDTTPSADDHTDFGIAELATGSVVRTFRIANTGSADLSLTGTPLVELSGAHAGDFAVASWPDSAIAGNDTTLFRIEFDPTDVGTRTATVSIANDDSDENPYDFAIEGFCVSAPVITSPDAATATEGVRFCYRGEATDPDGPFVSLMFNELPAWLSADADSVYGTPPEGVTLTSFRMVATDGSLRDAQVVAVTVTPVNDAPVIISSYGASATEDMYFAYQAAATDPDGPSLSYGFHDLPDWMSSNASAVYGTPREGDGDTSFRVTVTDGSLSDTLTVGVEVTPVNDPPEITSPVTATATEDVYFSYLATAKDVDSPEVSYAFDEMPAWMFSTANHVYGAPPEGAGNTSFRIVASDGSLSDTLVVEISVFAVNDPPTITSPGSLTATEDIRCCYRATVSDPDVRGLSFSFDEMPDWLSAVGDSAFGTPREGDGDASFRVVVSDGVLSDTLTVDVTVTPVNDAPVITSAAAVEATEDVVFVYVVTAADPDGPAESFSFDQMPGWLSCDDKTVHGTPLEGEGDASFRIVASDGSLADTLVVAVTVNAQNDAPVITSAATADATEDVHFSYVAEATDVDGPTVSFSFWDLPEWLSAGADSVYGTPGDDAVNTTFEVVASDGSLSDTLTVTVAVTQVADVLTLHANSPNPFAGETTIQYELPAAEDVEVTIYDVSGREVVTLVEGARQAGAHEITWDARNAAGRRVAAGIYFARVTTRESGRCIKMLLLR